MSLTAHLRRTLYALLARWDRWRHAPWPELTILCYHSFGQDDWYFSTSSAALDEQLTLLGQHFKFLSLPELTAYLSGQRTISQPSLMFTIDDGYQNILDSQSIWKKHHVTPTVFLLAQPEAANRAELDNSLPFLQPSQIARLQTAGWTFGCHTATHPNLASVPTPQLKIEITQAQQMLTQLLGTKCEWLAYPRGKYTPAVLKTAAQAGFTLGLTMDDAIISPQSDPLTLPRIGINQSHSATEIINMMSPSSLRVRKTLKKLLQFAI